MSVSEDFIADDEQGFEEESNYPTAFGITLTPMVSGVILAVLGVLGSVYVLLNFVMPVYESYQKLKTEQEEKEQQVKQLKSGRIDRKIIDLQLRLEQAEAQKAQVLSLFANEKTSNTVLLDINRFFQSRNVNLVSFEPQGAATVVTDSSLGTSANNKLKRQSISVAMEGSFEQTQAVLRDIERLQPLLVVKNLTTEQPEQKVQAQAAVNQGKVVLQNWTQPKLTTKFRLDLIIPLSKEELAKATPPPQQESKK